MLLLYTYVYARMVHHTGVSSNIIHLSMEYHACMVLLAYNSPECFETAQAGFLARVTKTLFEC